MHVHLLACLCLLACLIDSLSVRLSVNVCVSVSLHIGVVGVCLCLCLCVCVWVSAAASVSVCDCVCGVIVVGAGSDVGVGCRAGVDHLVHMNRKVRGVGKGVSQDLVKTFILNWLHARLDLEGLHHRFAQKQEELHGFPPKHRHSDREFGCLPISVPTWLAKPSSALTLLVSLVCRHPHACMH